MSIAIIEAAQGIQVAASEGGDLSWVPDKGSVSEHSLEGRCSLDCVRVKKVRD
jgi:hypothetical protein